MNRIVGLARSMTDPFRVACYGMDHPIFHHGKGWPRSVWHKPEFT